MRVGRELDRPLARTLRRELRRAEALRLASRALRLREHSVAGLDARLARQRVAPAARKAALEAAGYAGAVDDTRFARTRSEWLAARGWGDAGIRADLERHGVATEAAAAAVSELPTERRRAADVVARRGASAATGRYLAARGFDPDAVEAALPGLIAGDG